jgi:hypothetical protein
VKNSLRTPQGGIEKNLCVEVQRLMRFASDAGRPMTGIESVDAKVAKKARKGAKEDNSNKR